MQGVGFRPWVHALAEDLGLCGFVRNTGAGACIELEGDIHRLRKFQTRFPIELPPHAFVSDCESRWLPFEGSDRFEILESDCNGSGALALPDIAPCDECLREIRDSQSRRFGYAFTNCAHCGPRYSILEGLPYDRARTSMNSFDMCTDCRKEYENPTDRRFHAQPIACPVCGPQIQWRDSAGTAGSVGGEALNHAVDALLDGRIVAIKGVGGFHLYADANNQFAVSLLRDRKVRDEKPFAVLVPNLDMARELCEIDSMEARALASPEAPIVLCRRKANKKICEMVAPGNPYLGLMLPHSPLQHLLMDRLRRPCVATSGNRSGECICFDNEDALRRLGGIADGFLLHDRPIVRPIDDSIVRIVLERMTILRRARGWAPLPVDAWNQKEPVLAVGAQQKNTIALAGSGIAVLSQHLGDLDTAENLQAFRESVRNLGELFFIKPKTVVCDLHPDYASTREASAWNLPIIPVQHHFAHVLACMGEHGLEAPVLGIAWDGFGFGDDGTLWGGEFLHVTEKGYQRIAHIKPFPLPGGEIAAREPRRAALGLLFAALGEDAFEATASKTLRAFTTGELKIIRQMLQSSFRSPLTSSVGRLFDAVASLIGIRHRTQYEGQAAMDLEFHAEPSQHAYGFEIQADESGGPWQIALAIRELLSDLSMGICSREVSGRFHYTLVEIIVRIAARAGIQQVVLSGGCFQNRYLLEASVMRLRREGFDVYWPQQVPLNDGGIAYGQVLAAARYFQSTKVAH